MAICVPSALMDPYGGFATMDGSVRGVEVPNERLDKELHWEPVPAGQLALQSPASSKGARAWVSVMSSTVAVPEIEEEIQEGDETRDETERLYHVILLDDNDHTYEYVIEMLMELFGFSEQKAYEHTVEVDTKGHSRLTTCKLEEAEKKRDQIHAYGPDWRLPRSMGSMAALIEPAC